MIIADNTLTHVEDDEIHLTLLELKSLKKEILALKHRISNTTINHINFIVEGAEQFLSKSLAEVSEIVRENVKWTSEEEKEKIIEMIYHPKTNFSQPMIMKISSKNSTTNIQANYPSKMSEGLKASLANAKIVIQKIKEEKEHRKGPLQVGGHTTENKEVIKKIDTLAVQKPSKIENGEGQKINKTSTADHVKPSNATLEAFNKDKDGSHKFIDKVFHRNNTNNVRVTIRK